MEDKTGLAIEAILKDKPEDKNEMAFKKDEELEHDKERKEKGEKRLKIKY